MVYLNVLVLLECDAVEACGESEHSLNHLRQFEVGAQHLCIEIELAHLQLVRVESEVPRFEFESFAFSVLRLTLYCLHLLNCGRLVGINQVVEQFVDIAHVRCHAMNEHIVGKSFVAQKLGYLSAQIDESLAYFEVVLTVVVSSLGVACHIQLLAQFALGAVGHERREAGIVESEKPSFLVGLLGSKSGSLASCFGQTVELCLVGYV